MKPELLSLLSFAIGIAAYTVSQLQQHGKLRWSKSTYGFFGHDSHLRKYKNISEPGRLYEITKAPSNWYYNTFKIKYREAFFLSSTILVFLTDFYHASQFLFFLFISLSVVPILGWTYGIAFWIVAHITHFILYRTLQR